MCLGFQASILYVSVSHHANATEKQWVKFVNSLDAGIHLGYFDHLTL